MAKPSPLPIGRPSLHVIQSRGAEPNIMNFYCSNYSTSFTRPSSEYNRGKHFDIPAYSAGVVFKPKTAPENKRTGYISNVRPQIYYNRALDEFDNPEMGLSCAENYDTTTNLHYQPYKTLDGKEDIPVEVLGQTTSYTQKAYNHHSRPDDVWSNFIDTKIRAPYDVLPKHRTKLDTLNNKDPIPHENYGHGPNYMSTEASVKFQGKQRPEVLDKNVASVGSKETSGFVMNKYYEDAISGYPGERWLSYYRPTGATVYKDKFLPYSYAKSESQLPNISNLNGTKSSPFVKHIQPSDINPRHQKFTDTTETKDEFVPKPFYKETTLSQKMGTAAIGHVNETAQTLCEKGFTQTFDDARRFYTNYQINHYDMNTKGKDSEGMVTGGIYGPLENGYTLNVKTHNKGNLNAKVDLNNMDSYQSRSVRAKDRFYEDSAHDHKLTLKTNNIVAY